VRKVWQKFLKNERGHFAVQFALLGLPLVVATTFVVDYAGAGTEKVNVKTALDAAVIAAVNNNSLTLSEKEAYAKKHFSENYRGDIQFKLKPKALESRVEMSAFGVAPVTVAATLGIDGIELFEESAAEISSENTICVMSLAPEGEEVITFEEGVTFAAPTCSVHANSAHSNAIVSSGKTPPLAKSFCAVGGAQGEFSPYAKGQCKSIADPYEHISIPLAGPCISGTSLDGKGKDKGFTLDDKDVNIGRTESDTDSENSTGDNVILYPGTYCGGLLVDGIGVTFRPGIYTMLEGELKFKDSAVAHANDVTFILEGEKAKLKIEKGADVFVKAPSNGSLAGLAFIQKPFLQLGKKKAKREVSEVKSGGKLEILGTLYFPENTLKISGDDSAVGAQAPATSFIAYNIHFGKDEKNDKKLGIGGYVTVAVDHVAAGIPPILPRVEDGARLVQ